MLLIQLDDRKSTRVTYMVIIPFNSRVDSLKLALITD